VSRPPWREASNRFKILVVFGALAGMLGCQVRSRPLAQDPGRGSAPARAPGPGPQNAPSALPAFTDVASRSGVSFHHSPGATHPLTILQTAGAGCAVFDFDNDGRLDLFLVGSARTETGAPLHALYRNNRDGLFTDVTATAGLAGSGYGMGCVTADYDGDGDLDLYVTSYGTNALYRNNGDGTFTDVAARAGVATRGWSTSAAFADYDGDGWLDLYVARYVVFNTSTPQLCPRRGVPLACSPTVYDPQSGVLYHNNGKCAGAPPGTFTDVTRQAGAISAGRSLGVVWCDYDGDGRASAEAHPRVACQPDLFVANDNAPNNLFHNEGSGQFRDVAVAAGVAYGPQGNPEASMGVDFGDYDGDGRPDLLFTNFQHEGAGLYRNEGKRGFFAAADRAGVLAATLPVLGFGAGFLDVDNDGHLDLFMVNGHVQEAIQQVDPACSFAQPRQLFRNRGDGTFKDLTAACGAAMTSPAVGRGAAFGDFDSDGDVDILVNNNGGPAMLLRNEVGRRHHWLRLRLVGRAPNRFAVGARVTTVAGDLRQVREVRAGHSYASASDVRLQFGLGDHPRADRVVVRWPGGRQAVLRSVPADQEVTLRE
jgi:enediyne biosynthesis protein E4